MPSAPGPLGAYGLILQGLEGAARWMQPQEAGAPTLEVRVTEAPASSEPSRVEGDRADLALLGGGRLHLVKGKSEARYFLPEIPPPSDLLHPYLAPAAALYWHWAGREALHGGAFCTPQGAVIVLGDKGAGKSTTLGWLAAESGHDVLADDLVIIDQDRVRSGPRAIDLRPSEDLEHLGAPVRGGVRVRQQLGPVSDRVPLRALVTLAWGPGMHFAKVPLAERLSLLAPQRTTWGAAPRPAGLLGLAQLPMVRATRAHELSSLPEFGRALLAQFA